jgi:hypothetical protein
MLMGKVAFKNTKSPLKKTSSRRPGQSLDEQITRLQGEVIQYLLVVGLLAMGALGLWIEYFYQLLSTPIIFTVLFLIFLVYSFLKMNTIKIQLKNLTLGRDGEREVAEYLDNLTRRGCYVFHDVIGDNFNIDHVVVSNHGIFTLETKAYSKPIHGEAKIDFDGQTLKLTGKLPSSEIGVQALAEAKWLRNQIKELANGKIFNITAIVVFPGWYIPQEQMKFKDIWVTNPNWIESLITKLPQTLNPDDVQTVVKVIRSSFSEQRPTA